MSWWRRLDERFAQHFLVVSKNARMSLDPTRVEAQQSARAKASIRPSMRISVIPFIEHERGKGTVGRAGLLLVTERRRLVRIRTRGPNASLPC